MLIGIFQSLAKMPDIYVHIDNKPFDQIMFAKYIGMFNRATYDFCFKD